jgi:hypothetical protein
VPDDSQAALWDSRELDRLARLRQLAIETGVPDDALRLIDSASTADEAIDRLTIAGFMPPESESGESVLAYFAPLLDPMMSQLDAEMCASMFIAEMRRGAPPNLDVADVLRDVIESFSARRRREALVMMRALSAVGPGDLRLIAASAAAQMARDGVTDVAWGGTLGSPRPGICFGYADTYGAQRSVVITFRYGRKAHALVVLIDYILGGGIKDIRIDDDATGLRKNFQHLARDPDLVFSELAPAEARAILVRALARPPCPVEPDQIAAVEESIDLLRARVATMSGASRSVRQAGQQPGPEHAAATRRKAPPRNVHQVKVTLRGVKPPIWRRLEVPSDSPLERLHRVIQAAFRWQDVHLHVFETTAGWYGIPDPDAGTDIKNDAYKKLSAVADWPGDRVRYVYDFGENRELDIVVEAVSPAEPGVRYPRCIAGRRAAPPEDGGRADPAAAFDPETVNFDLAPMSRVLVKR